MAWRRNIDKAISFLEKKIDQILANHQLNNTDTHNMFICKNKEILTKYYELFVARDVKLFWI